MKVPILFLTILGLLLFPLASYAEPLERFVDKEYGYSIHHPSSWKARIYRSGIVLAEIISQEGRSGLQVRMTRSAAEPGDFVDQYLNHFMLEMQAFLINKTQRKIGPISGYTITFRAKRGNSDHFLKSYILPARNRSLFYIFQSGAPFKEKDLFEPILDAIADSFRLDALDTF